MINILKEKYQFSDFSGTRGEIDHDIFSNR